MKEIRIKVNMCFNENKVEIIVLEIWRRINTCFCVPDSTLSFLLSKTKGRQSELHTFPCV